MSKITFFTKGDIVVYPVHGVGRIEDVETQNIAGYELQVYVIKFTHDRMTLRLPVKKADSAGLRKLSSLPEMETALKTLKGNAKIRKLMWSRRAQEYEAKINSGVPGSIAEVVRDLHRSSKNQEQSYSERQIYQSALERLTRELAAVEGIEENSAAAKVETFLKKAA
ncbi:MAG: CarD family transcriptional regulator [Alphaproteobacteria bacterium]|jgi:CarD family transcriptional regulator|nr:CarD family transcriptional regulator [Alphaproteobacteria bacterium]MBT5390652.1 CarD family transcriptional regulator [Alphaproteobacteria bacterium]MBT5540252.1 CarD family transcriptional regulator [Alphaproteobacteria bacterium]MBT5654076.1 CarD family transcriptional regulator [Alphaproteobacteria bacterium]